MFTTNPCILLTWLFRPAQTIEFDEGAGAVLRIQPLRAPRDENIYECVAENSEGEITVNAKLSIIRGESCIMKQCAEGYIQNKSLKWTSVSSSGFFYDDTLPWSFFELHLPVSEGCTLKSFCLELV